MGQGHTGKEMPESGDSRVFASSSEKRIDRVACRTLLNYQDGALVL